VALACHHNIRELVQASSKRGGIERVFNRPVFHEKVLRLAKPVAPVLAHMAGNGVLGGYDLSADYPELGNALLVCTTETKTPADIQRFISALDLALLAE
jgi:glycine dehydrogenase subunit 1